MLDSRKSPKRPNLRWNRRKIEMFFLLILGVLAHLRNLEAAPLETSTSKITRHEETLISGLPTKKGHEKEVGLPSELAWQAWLLVDGRPESQSLSGLDSASLLRRITPKSIFIAPALTACAEGYQADTMNRCVKDVSVDHQAHFGFLVERLNAMYANVGKPQASSFSSSSSSSSASSSSSSSSSLPTGPLQLNIPLFMSAPPKPVEEIPKTNLDEKRENHEKISSTTEDNLKISQDSHSQKEPNDRDAIVTVYELDDEMRENESTFFLGNKSTEILDKDSNLTTTKLDHGTIIVPVAEFIDDPDTNHSDIVDYKIPVAIEKIFNHTKFGNSNDSEIETHSDKEETDKNSEISPTLVLLLSPTKLPSIPISESNDLVVAHNSSLGQVIIKMENFTGNMTGGEIISVSVPETLSSSVNPMKNNSKLDEDLRISDVNLDEEKKDELFVGIDQRHESNEKTTIIYDEDEDENYEESTEIEDEILKHSEAGMTVILPTDNEKTRMETSTMKFQSGGNVSDNEPTGSSEISSEVSINDDFVRETTLVDFNVSKMKNSSIFTTPTASSEETKKHDETTTNLPPVTKVLEIPEIIIQSSDYPRNDKRDGHLTKVDKFHEDSASKDHEKILSESSKLENHEEEMKKTDESEKSPELIFPVRGIEEALEYSLDGDSSSTERADSAETMIAASTNEASAVISREKPKFEMPSEKQAVQPLRFSDQRTTSKISSRPLTSSISEGVYDYEPHEYPPNRKNPYYDDSLPVIRTFDEQRRRPEMNFDSSRDHDENGQFFPSQDYVRFPNYESRQQESYVRFPAEEANSIHSSNDYKERNRRPYVGNEEIYYRGPENTRIPAAVHQKESYWWLPSGWRNERQQTSFQQKSKSTNTNEQRSRDRAPMLLRFWTRMPLVKDPSLYPTRPSPSAERRQANSRMESPPFSRSNSRRVNYYREMSNRDINRAFARNIPAIGD